VPEFDIDRENKEGTTRGETEPGRGVTPLPFLHTRAPPSFPRGWHGLALTRKSVPEFEVDRDQRDNLVSRKIEPGRGVTPLPFLHTRAFPRRRESSEHATRPPRCVGL